MANLYPVLFAVSGTGVLTVIALFVQIFRTKVSDTKALKISDAISRGAMTFLKEEYKIITAMLVVIALAICYVLGKDAALVFSIGSIFSMTAGFIGMRAATGANVRTTTAAKQHGERGAFMSAFFGGGVMGFTVATVGLIGVTGLM